MKKLLIIALLFVGCVFGDTITFNKKILFNVSKMTLEDVEYEGIELVLNVVYLRFTKNGSPEYVKCMNMIKWIDANGNEVENNCLPRDEFALSKPADYIDDSKNIFENDLISSGHLLIEFRNKFYRGAKISMIGAIITSMGAIISLNTTQPNKYYFYPGIAITLYGNIVSFLSFNKAGQAGHELIKGGEELEKEKSVEKNKSE